MGGEGRLEPHFQVSLALLIKGLVITMYHPLSSRLKLETMSYLFQWL